MKRSLILTLIAFCSWQAAQSQVYNYWRGPARDGIYPEKNLLKEWPSEGPHINWVYEELGEGFSSPVIANEEIYISGMENGQGYVYVLTMDGEHKRTIGYGPERTSDYPGSRVSPTVVGDLMYIVSAYGRLSCLNVKTGEPVWTKDFLNDIDGRNIEWGITENLIIEEDTLYSAPGGEKNNIVALNRHTGDIIWSSQAQGDPSAYCSPLLFEHNGRRIFTTHMSENIVGLDASTGELLWSHPFKNRWDIHPNTPVYHDGGMFFVSGYNTGSIKFNLSKDGSSISKAWENELDTQMGGVILHDGFIYGAGHNNRFWFCIDWASGETQWQSRSLAHGPVILADGMLYIYSERGELALAQPSSQDLIIKSQTRVTHGTKQHWAYPVIQDGTLYIRHGNALIAYSIKDE